MRLITPEEDKLLDEISKLKDNIKILELDIMTEECETKGNKRKKSFELTNFLIWFSVSSILFFIFLGYLVVGQGALRMISSMAMFFGAGGFGLATIGIWIYTGIVYVKFRCRTSRFGLWIALADKIGIDNINYEDDSNSNHLRNDKNQLQDYKYSLQEKEMEYDLLKDRLDRLYEAGATVDNKSSEGNIILDRNNINDLRTMSNMQVQTNWFEEKDNLKSTINKNRVKLNLLRNRKDQHENKLMDIDVIQYQVMSGRRGMTLFSLFFGIIAAGLLLAGSLPSTEPAMSIRFYEMAAIVFAFAIMVFVVVYFLTMPSLSDSFVACKLGDIFGIYLAQKAINDIQKDMKQIDAEIIELDEETDLLIKEYKSLNDNDYI